MRNWKEISIIPTTAFLLTLLLWVAHQEKSMTTRVVPAPDFGAIKDVKVKKEKFFSYVVPLVHQSNREIRSERAALLKITDKINHQQTLSKREKETIEALARKYRVTNIDPFSKDALALLERRIDIVPPSLALAQAANESAWGTARFAVKGNNYFGLWCWSSDCGLVPNERAEGKKHEVSTFNAPVDSVKYYMLTLNSHPTYKKLRELRSQARANNKPLTGTLLSDGLLSYSERGTAYIKELRAMIRVNNLSRFNQTTSTPAP